MSELELLERCNNFDYKQRLLLSCQNSQIYLVNNVCTITVMQRTAILTFGIVITPAMHQ